MSNADVEIEGSNRTGLVDGRDGLQWDCGGDNLNVGDGSRNLGHYDDGARAHRPLTTAL